jgi:hypothetical protein
MNFCTFCGNAFEECECRDRARCACQNIFSGVPAVMLLGFTVKRQLEKRFSNRQWADFLEEARLDRRAA